MAKCWSCDHTFNLDENGHKGWSYNRGPCQTITVSGKCKCKEYVYGCSFPKCSDKATRQYESEYSEETNPFLCETHDELREFIEDCVKGALRKL